MPASLTEITNKLNDAFAKHHAGDIDAAIALYRDVLSEQPQQPDALHMLGVVAQQRGNPTLALQLIDASLAIQKTGALAWKNRATILRVLGRNDEALDSARQAISISPTMGEAWDVCASLYAANGNFTEAERHAAEAYKLSPNDPSVINNYALVLMRRGDYTHAYNVAKHLEKTEDVFPALTLGNILKAAGHPKRAIACYEKVRTCFPKIADVHINEATARLQIGDMAEGWRLWEMRPDSTTRYNHLTYWDGAPVKSLILYEDQGLGDALQCARYFRHIRGRVENITLYITPALVRLFAHNFSYINVRSNDDAVVTADARARLISLPAIFKTDLENIPPESPYLYADENLRNAWRERLRQIKSPRIGLVWGGNPLNRKDHLRSVPFDQIADYCKKFAPHIISLQKGAQKSQADLAALNIFDADSLLSDFSEAAALIAELDLVISVDTAVVHLAGAVGTPAWMFTPFDPDFRWLLGREDSPWYPRLHLFRQTAPLGWSAPVSAITADTQKLIKGDVSVLNPSRWVGAPLTQDPKALPLA